MHPPRNIELSVHDELFVLSDRNPKEETRKSAQNEGQAPYSQSKMKNEEKKAQDGNITKLSKLNTQLRDLLFASKELE